MDPDATYRIMTDPASDLEERAVAATDLLVWMARLGSVPVSAPGRAECTDECKHHIFAALDKLNDLSGG